MFAHAFENIELISTLLHEIEMHVLQFLVFDCVHEF